MLAKSPSIKQWHPAERPSDKMLLNSPRFLSDSELLAILIGSGNSRHNAIALAREVQATVQNNLDELGKCTMKDLMKIRGIGKAKAAAIVAALELGRRRQSKAAQHNNYIRNSHEAAFHIRPLLMDYRHEVFGVIYLSQAGWIKSFDIISEGGITSTVVDPRIIFKKALEHDACSIVCFHNHPSGSIRPSAADVSLTQKLHAAAKTMDIQLMDHIIVADSGFYSFADDGRLN